MKFEAQYEHCVYSCKNDLLLCLKLSKMFDLGTIEFYSFKRLKPIPKIEKVPMPDL